jgi:hypothetical protein
MSTSLNTGHGRPDQERRLNHGLQHTPSGRSVYPVPRNSAFHRSINQSLPELWSDFSDRGLPDARAGHDEGAHGFHDGSHAHSTAPGRFAKGGHMYSRSMSAAGAMATARTGQCVFVGFAEFDVDGRHQTSGEMDRIMQWAAGEKYPCSRPATLDEYERGVILGLPERNRSGRDIVFTGPGATGCELFHTNTFGSQKCVVSRGDTFDGQTGAASLHGRKCCICVYPVERMRKQASLTQFGLARHTTTKAGGFRRSNSLVGLTDGTKWTRGDYQI